MVITIVANATPTGLVVIALENYVHTVVAILNVLVAALAIAAPAHANVLMVTAVPHASVSPARTTAMAKARATPALACVAVPVDTPEMIARFACARKEMIH